jgi:hypothetical protein
MAIDLMAIDLMVIDIERLTPGHHACEGGVSALLASSSRREIWKGL